MTGEAESRESRSLQQLFFFLPKRVLLKNEDRVSCGLLEAVTLVFVLVVLLNLWYVFCRWNNICNCSNIFNNQKVFLLPHMTINMFILKYLWYITIGQ